MGWSSKYMLLFQWVYTPFNSYVGNSSDNRWFGVRPTISRESEARLPIPEFEWVFVIVITMVSKASWLATEGLSNTSALCGIFPILQQCEWFSSGFHILVISGKSVQETWDFQPANIASHEKSTMTLIHFSLKPSTVHVKTTRDWCRLDPMLDGFKMKRISL